MPQPATASLTADAHTLGRWFTGARRQGFLALLTPEAWHALSAILSFTCRDGQRPFTIDQLAVALGQSPEVARQRLEALTETDWHGQPLARLEFDRDGGVAGVTLAPIELFSRIVPPDAPPDSASPDAPSETPPAERAAPPPADLTAALEKVGLDPDQVTWLIESFPAERIRRQLDWLPARQARNPAAMLIRAVEQNWGPPREAG